MDEVDPKPVDLGTEVRQRIQLSFLPAPIEAVAPITAKLAEIGEIGSVSSARTICLVWPADVVEARDEIVEDLLFDVDREWPHRVDVRLGIQ